MFFLIQNFIKQRLYIKLDFIVVINYYTSKGTEYQSTSALITHSAVAQISQRINESKAAKINN